MARAYTTGQNGTQIQLVIHGDELAPLNIGPSKDLWHTLGEALATAEQNRGALLAAGSTPPEQVPETGTAATPGVVPVAGTPDVIEDPTAEAPEGNQAPGVVGDEAGKSPEEAVHAANETTPPATDEGGFTPFNAQPELAPEDAEALTKKELAARLEAEGVDVPSSARKGDLVKLAAHDYEHMTRAELKQHLDRQGVDYPDDAKKAELVKLAEES